MKTTAFNDLASFAVHLAAQEVALQHHMHNGLEKALVVIEKDCKDRIGHYQSAADGFPAWPALADSTEKQKAAMGAPQGAPLLRHGGLYASFQHETSGATEGVVGSTDPVMVFHEFGTSKMPPRPVVGPAVAANREKIERILGQAVVSGVIGGEIAAGGAEYFGFKP